MKAEHLMREFAQRCVPGSRGQLLLGAADALALVERATEEGVPVMRVYACIVRPTHVESPVEQRADFFDAVERGHGCWQEAEAFIHERRDMGFVFEVKLGGDPIEAV